MPETFLILFAGGIMLAAAISDPEQVTLQWLRLGGIIALAMTALSLFFVLRRDGGGTFGQALFYALSVAAILAQLGFVQVAWRHAQRYFAAAAFAVAVLAGAALSPQRPVDRGMELLSLAGIAALTGLVLMDMLLGHAYLTASRMTMKPFARLNLAVAATLTARAVTAIGIALWMESRRPLPMFWGVHGVLIGTRWLVGLAVPSLFIYMAHDCIKRRSTQAATGILYVAGVLVMIGEITALVLLRNTGLPF
jgi:hypothetical protein